MENLETFLKNEEKEYKKIVLEKSTSWLETEYHSFNLAINENVQRLNDAYQNYISKDTEKTTFERKINQQNLFINHWQKMIEIVVEELLKRS